MTVVDKYLYKLEHVNQLSINTVLAKRSDLKLFEVYVSSFYNKTDLLDIDKSVIRSFVVHLSDSNYSSASINRVLSSVKVFYDYLQKEGLVELNPALSLSNLRVKDRLPVYVKQSKLNDLLNFENLSLRDQLIILILITTGMRRSELISLKIDDVDFDNKQLVVLGKGNKERLLPLTSYVLSLITAYIDSERIGDVRYLITTDKGKQSYPKLIYNVVNKHLKKFNLSETSSPHILRHTFATYLLNNGADINAVKDLLGHASLSATQIYTHNSIEKLKNSYKKHHPKK